MDNTVNNLPVIIKIQSLVVTSDVIEKRLKPLQDTLSGYKRMNPNFPTKRAYNDGFIKGMELAIAFMKTGTYGAGGGYGRTVKEGEYK